MYRFTIYDEYERPVRSVVALSCTTDSTLIGFSTDGEMVLIYHLPAGYSITKEEVK